MTRRQAARYAELERMDRAGVSIQEQARRLGLSVGRAYNVRTEARAAGFQVAAATTEQRGRRETGCARCGLRGPHVCVGRATDYLRSRDDAEF